MCKYSNATQLTQVFLQLQNINGQAQHTKSPYTLHKTLYKQITPLMVTNVYNRVPKLFPKYFPRLSSFHDLQGSFSTTVLHRATLHHFLLLHNNHY